MENIECSHFGYCINIKAVVYSICGAIRNIGRRHETPIIAADVRLVNQSEV